MLAYAANRPRVGASRSSPNTLLFVACGHIALLAVAMSVKMALPPTVKDPPIPVIRIAVQKPPPKQPVQTRDRHDPVNPTMDQPTPNPRVTTVEPEVPLNTGTPLATGPSVDPIPLPPIPLPLPEPQPVGISRGAQLVTPAGELKPPYPQAKLLAEEEATLRLRLSIDETGRVIAVDPVGRADAAFLSAARRHLLSHWRYKPAMKDGRAVPTSIVISLRFQLDA